MMMIYQISISLLEETRVPGGNQRTTQVPDKVTACPRWGGGLLKCSSLGWLLKINTCTIQPPQCVALDKLDLNLTTNTPKILPRIFWKRSKTILVYYVILPQRQVPLVGNIFHLRRSASRWLAAEGFQSVSAVAYLLGTVGRVQSSIAKTHPLTQGNVPLPGDALAEFSPQRGRVQHLEMARLVCQGTNNR